MEGLLLSWANYGKELFWIRALDLRVPTAMSLLHFSFLVS